MDKSSATDWTSARFRAGDDAERFRVVYDMVPRDASSLTDIGCGNAAFLAYVEQVSGTGLKLLGVEPSSVARESALAESPVVAGSMSVLDHELARADVITCLEVLEHLDEESFGLAVELLGALAGRRVLISVPYRERRVMVRCTECGCVFERNGHVRSFDMRDMESLLKGCVLADHEYVSAKTTWPRMLARRLWRIPGRPKPGSVCPQCGHGWVHDADQVAAVSSETPARKGLLETQENYWIVAAYDVVQPPLGR